MDGDLDLREAFDRGFGPEPPHRHVAERVAAGHRAVRRRRAVGTVLTVAVATVVGLGAVAVLNDRPAGPGSVADDPTSSPTSDEWTGDLPAQYTEDGLLEVRPGATVKQRIDEPLGDPTAGQRSVALAVDYRRKTTWMLLVWRRPTDGVRGSTAISATPTGVPFEDWVAGVVDPQDGYLGFAPDGSLVPTRPGVRILEQRHPIELKDFALNNEPTGAALLQGLDGKRWYAVARELDGVVDIIPVPFGTGGEDLDAFLDYARQMYGGGVGLR